jgi:c-di-GMP-binding flagellar brake protein YcgR
MFVQTRPEPPTAAVGRDDRDDRQAIRVSHAGDCLALLRQLRDDAVPVQLSGPHGHAATATLWSVDDGDGDSDGCRINLSLGAHPDTLPGLAEADELMATAYLENVKLQFDIVDPLLVHGREGTTLQAGRPREIYRFQRRDAYRVRTLERSSPTAQLRHPALPEMVLPLRVVDVSIGGCALFVPHDVPPLQPGTRLNAVRIELDTETRYDAGLLLQHVTAIDPGQRGVRLGCEWAPLSAAAARALQRYIDQTQKRRRQWALDGP